jgi:murein DD-endopeptidase MepM/ murein hydrolase activator NlpD
MTGESDQERNAIRKRLKQLRRSYVLALVNRRTFEEKASIKLTPMNLLFLFGGGFLLVCILFIALVSFTPLKRYIPGFPGEEMEERSVRAMAKADSLEYELELMKEHFSRIRAVMRGDEELSDSLEEKAPNTLHPGSSESPRKMTHRAADQGVPMREYFFPPLRGPLTDAFDPSAQHFGVDLTARKGKAIKAVLEGTVVFASWTPEQGKVIQIQHPQGLLSVYKHNSVLLKEAGQKVGTGDPIAVIGNTGSITTGPHLHFELWYRGDPVDPEKVMVF